MVRQFYRKVERLKQSLSISEFEIGKVEFADHFEPNGPRKNHQIQIFNNAVNEQTILKKSGKSKFHRISEFCDYLQPNDPDESSKPDSKQLGECLQVVHQPSYKRSAVQIYFLPVILLFRRGCFLLTSYLVFFSSFTFQFRSVCSVSVLTLLFGVRLLLSEPCPFPRFWVICQLFSSWLTKCSTYKKSWTMNFPMCRFY